jgi:hypothetical protein
MTGIRLIRALALANLLVLLGDLLYNVFGGLLPMLQ